MTNLPVVQSHGERAHSEIGGSKVPRYMACPGSVPLSRAVPPEPEEGRSIYARTGTCAHEVAELCLRHGTEPELYIGTQHDGVEVDHEMAEYVSMYVNKVRQVAELEHTEPMVEVQFDLERLNPPAPAFGTADAVIAGENHLHIFDLKYGSGIVVEVIDNKQELFYAVGAVLELDRVFEHITLWIVQPRAEHEDGPIRAWTISWEDLVAFRKDLQAAWRQTELGPNAPLNAGKHCRYCRAAAVCPELKAQAEKVAQRAFADIPPTPPSKAAAIAQAEASLPAPEGLTDDELAEVLSKAGLIRRWLDNVEKFVHDRLVVHGGQLDGYKAVRRYGHRAWADEKVLADELTKWGLTPEDLVDTKPITPAEAERRLWAANDELTRAEVKELVAPLVIRPERGYAIVDAADKRPEAALETEARSAFAAVQSPDEGEAE